VIRWDSEDRPVPRRLGPGDWLRAGFRGAAMVAVTYGALVVLLLVRLVEAPMFGPRRPWTPWITQGVCRANLWLSGTAYRVMGRAMTGSGAVVANHASWFDIFTLNACQRVTFVSKAEVAGWAGIGWLARATGTLFIERDRRAAGAQARVFAERLRAGERLLFFPEGTSTDGRRVLPFKTTLFGAFFDDGLRGMLHVQPVSVIYHAPPGADARHYGWWGDMEFGPHLLSLLAHPGRGRAEVIFHPALAVADYPDRKALARACEDAVRAGVEGQIGAAMPAGSARAAAAD
jgi:1-acyl-sn-glycerol-3-phosphate acyltransferase